MNENTGRLLAAGNVAEVFEWGCRIVKLYRSSAAKQAAFREAANHAAIEALGLPVPAVWGVQQINRRRGIVFDRISEPSFAEACGRIRPLYLDTLRYSPAYKHASMLTRHTSSAV